MFKMKNHDSSSLMIRGFIEPATKFYICRGFSDGNSGSFPNAVETYSELWEKRGFTPRDYIHLSFAVARIFDGKHAIESPKA